MPDLHWITYYSPLTPSLSPHGERGRVRGNLLILYLF